MKNKQANLMKKVNVMKNNQANRVVGLLAILVITLLNATCAQAQVKVDDKEIIGVWKMTSMKFEGESKELINENYNQIKVYRANGEYACAEIARMKNGDYVVLPHEYGTYSLKNGMYSEMGRKAIKYNWINKTTSAGRWMNRIDRWEKINIPETLIQHIVNKCKAAQTEPEHLQKLIKQYVFKK